MSTSIQQSNECYFFALSVLFLLAMPSLTGHLYLSYHKFSIILSSNCKPWERLCDQNPLFCRRKLKPQLVMSHPRSQWLLWGVAEQVASLDLTATERNRYRDRLL